MKRTLIGTTVLLIALGTILFLPLPHYVDCEFQIRPKNVTQVYIRVPGEIREVFVNQGDEITAGSSILQTTNPDLELLHSRQQGKLATIELQVDLFKKSALNGNEYSQRQLSSSLAELKNQIQLVEKTKALLDQLTIVAPVSGTILPVNDEDNVDARTSNVSNEIRVFDPEFSNSPLPIGFLVCQIGDPLDLEAVMMIDEKQMDFVRPGQTVQFRTASRTWNQLESKLASLERQNNKQDQLNLPTSSSNSNHPAAASDPLTANYMATAKLQADDPQVLFMSGRARIYTGNRTIGNRLMRWFADTFRFQL